MIDPLAGVLGNFEAPSIPETGAPTGLRYAPPMGRKPMIYARAVGRARVGQKVETAISPQSTPKIRK
jgi:hypothetical protein